QVDAANGVASADLVEQFDQRDGVEFLSVHRIGSAGGESDRDSLLAVGCFFRRASELPGGVEGRVGRIFQLSAFLADVPKVAIAAVNLLTTGCHGDAALLGVVQAVFA